jgi:hypothetical protein
LKDIIWEPIQQSDISWNFCKFIVDKTGQPRYRWPHNHEPVELYDDIVALINE